MTDININSETLSLAELRAQMAELKDTIETFQLALKPLKRAAEELTSEKDGAYQEYLQKVAKIDREKNGIDKQIAEIKKEAEKHKAEFDRLESALDQAIQVEKSEAELKALEDRWNKLTAGAPWREFAFNHQLTGSDKMVFNRRVILADPMGLGKTLTAIITCDKIKAGTSEGDVWWEDIKNSWGDIVQTKEHRDAPAGRFILYLSPSALVRNVQPEWKKWAPHRDPVVLSKRNKLQREIYLETIEEMKEEGSDILVLCNYEAWRKDLAFLERLISIGFDTIILDEAHALKDRGSLAYRGVAQILAGTDRLGNKIAEPIRFIYPMTGTPFLNRPQELYSILTLVEPRNFSNSRWGENNFLHNYCEPIPYSNKWKFRPGGIDSLAKLISNRYVRRTLQEAGIELPPQEITYHDLDIDEDLYPEQSKARQTMRNTAKIIISDQHAVVASIMLTVYLRLRQIETWPGGIKLKDGNGDIAAEVNVYQSQKLDYVISEDFEGLLPEVCPDQRTVVFSQFNEPLKVMYQRAMSNGLNAALLVGDTSEADKAEIRVDFDRTRCRLNGRKPKWDVLFANYKIGGEGLNLSDATQIICLDEEWSPGKENQAFGRVRRIGQTENSAVHIIRVNNTIDSWLAGIIEEKRELTGDFSAAMDKQAFLDALEKGEI
jgi:SNF2 family DNA or RNA helicase